ALRLGGEKERSRAEGCQLQLEADGMVGLLLRVPLPAATRWPVQDSWRPDRARHLRLEGIRELGSQSQGYQVGRSSLYFERLRRNRRQRGGAWCARGDDWTL